MAHVRREKARQYRRILPASDARPRHRFQPTMRRDHAPPVGRATCSRACCYTAPEPLGAFHRCVARLPIRRRRASLYSRSGGGSDERDVTAVTARSLVAQKVPFFPQDSAATRRALRRTEALQPIKLPL